MGDKMAFANLLKVILFAGLIVPLAACNGAEKMADPPQSEIRNHVLTKEERHDERFLLESYDINFNFNSASIPKSGLATLDQVRDDILKQHPREILITGYADSAGDKIYNLALSKKRAEEVIKALEQRGVKPSSMKVGFMGEDDSTVPTQDGVQFLENRRVSIDLRR
jgi:outer membrane protein OmpA-like peptidoglycan-associated protein